MAADTRRKIVILGAGGRDFHNFNVAFRERDGVEVVAFTATQIPGIEDRRYPPELAGRLYPDGIPIVPEEDLARLIREEGAAEAVFSYSDVSHEYVMGLASKVLALGADFRLLGQEATEIASEKPVLAVLAARTGCGKSQTTRRICTILREMGKKTVAIRHPMPYGDLVKQGVQRFETIEDLKRHDCTIEEMEEYEPHIKNGTIVYAGVDYEKILREAEKEADIVLWDGGNNDTSFYRPDLQIVVVDPLRPGHETRFHPGHTNLLGADVVVINKVESASLEGIEEVRRNVREAVPSAVVVDAASPLFVEEGEKIRGKRVLVIEDGPTLTHGGMTFGAGTVAARKYGAAEIVDPRPYLVGDMEATFRKYPEIGTLLPAMGYGEKQMADLQETINRTPCDLVVIGTPIDVRRILKLEKPSVRVTYELQEIGRPGLTDVLEEFLRRGTGR
ncbi:MAG: GTPase [Candidatus Eisenbacteria bacterium]|nr:GTPase [Candidatus Latescibacterota bacterium]MBD3302390.1 GTPase [Candidatus Eisenbacteria bacterium]